MALALSAEQQAIANGDAQGRGAAMAMRIVAATARLMGAPSLIPIASAHIDGALYHGDSGTLFAEKLALGGGKVAVRATLNVGSLDLTGCSKNRLPPHERGMARRMMDAYRTLGCEPSWTCAPYQAGHRPALGSDVAWGESNAVVFCNSVLGARTNRYGDFLDIACAISGFAPYYGLHRPENRRATVVFDVSGLDPAFLRLGGRLADPRQSLWPRGRRCGRRRCGRHRPPRRRCTEGIRRGFRFGRRCRPVPCRRRHPGSAGPCNRPASPAATSCDQSDGRNDRGFAPPPLHGA